MDVSLSSVSEHSVSELFCSEVTSCVTLTSFVSVFSITRSSARVGVSSGKKHISAKLEV